MKKSKNASISAGLQKTFVTVILGVYALNATALVYTWFTQYIHDPYVGGMEWWFIDVVLLPLAVFGIAYLLRPKQTNLLGQLFDTTIVSVIGLAAYTVVSSATQYIYSYNITLGSNYDLVVAYSGAGAAVFISSYALILLYLKKK